MLSLQVEFNRPICDKRRNVGVESQVEHSSFVHLLPSTQYMKGILTFIATVHSNAVYLWNEQIVCLHTLNTPPHPHTRVLMHTCMGGCTGGMASTGQIPAGKPTVMLTLRHWEPHGSVHEVAANIKEHWECPRAGTKVAIALRSCDTRE